MIVLLDNGHGAKANTNGKYSPKIEGTGINPNDPTIYAGRFREGNFNRIEAKGIQAKLQAKGVDCRIVVPEDADISLGERVRRINAICKQVGASNVLMVSVHANAAGNCDKFTSACGLSVHVCKGASNASKRLATMLYDAGAARGLKGNRYVPALHYWVDNFYMLTKTACPAVLTENLFYDNLGDLKFLTTEKGRETIVDYHVEAILKYLGK